MFRFASITTFFLEKYSGKHYTQLWSNFNLVFPKHTACKPNQNCNRLVLNLKNSFSLKNGSKSTHSGGVSLLLSINSYLIYFGFFRRGRKVCLVISIFFPFSPSDPDEQLFGNDDPPGPSSVFFSSPPSIVK